jgi:hypothetical protein
MTPLRSDPWPHLILDDFLPTTVFQECLSEIGAEDYNFEIENRGTGRIEFSLLKSKIAWRAVYSKETIALLSLAFGVKVTLNRGNYVQLRRMNAATPEFPVHNDFASNEDTIASFLYLSPGWRSTCGGRLHLYKTESQKVPSLSTLQSAGCVPHVAVQLAFRREGAGLGPPFDSRIMGRRRPLKLTWARSVQCLRYFGHDRDQLPSTSNQADAIQEWSEPDARSVAPQQGNPNRWDCAAALCHGGIGSPSSGPN